MVECCAGFVFVRRSVLATIDSSVLWLVVAAANMLFMYISTCGRMSEAVAVAAWTSERSMGPAVFALPKETPRCLFALLAQFAAA